MRTQFQKIKNITETVKSVLISNPECRDNDRKLAFKVWAIENPALRSEGFPLTAFALEFIHGQYTSFETISRARRKIQEQHPDLRGRGHATRKENQEEMRREMPAFVS